MQKHLREEFRINARISLMNGKALIVVDMQKGFLDKGHNLYCGPQVRRIVPRIIQLIEEEERKGSLIIFTQDTHTESDPEFKMFPRHCVEGMEESDLIEELKNNKGIRLKKSRFSSFYLSDLDKILSDSCVKDIVLCGVCTDICVLHTAADARNRDLKVTVYKNCVSSFDREAHEYALRHMKKILGVNISRFKPSYPYPRRRHPRGIS